MFVKILLFYIVAYYVCSRIASQSPFLLLSSLFLCLEGSIQVKDGYDCVYLYEFI